MDRFNKNRGYQSSFGANPRTVEGGKYGIMDGVGRHRNVFFSASFFCLSQESSIETSK